MPIGKPLKKSAYLPNKKSPLQKSNRDEKISMQATLLNFKEIRGWIKTRLPK
jgi:hypothetical protein